MYIDFIDTLRHIQGGIYPQIQKWYVEIKDSKDHNEKLKEDMVAIQEETLGIKCQTEAIKFDAQSWAEEEPDVNVNKYTCHDECGTITSAPVDDKSFSAKHWSSISEEWAGQSFDNTDAQWRAEAERMTAQSLTNELPNVQVKVYTSNGDGTFSKQELDGVYSALHYMTETENLSGQKRWVENQISPDGLKNKFTFTKNINHADVYENGIRQIDGIDYRRKLNKIYFLGNPPPIKANVTVSGMEAITGSLLEDFAETIRDEADRTKKYADDVETAELEIEAVRRTLKSYMTEAPNVEVSEFSVKPDGSIVGVTVPGMYSVLHYDLANCQMRKFLGYIDGARRPQMPRVGYASEYYIAESSGTVGTKTINIGDELQWDISSASWIVKPLHIEWKAVDNVPEHIATKNGLIKFLHQYMGEGPMRVLDTMIKISAHAGDIEIENIAQAAGEVQLAMAGIDSLISQHKLEVVSYVENSNDFINKAIFVAMGLIDEASKHEVEAIQRASLATGPASVLQANIDDVTAKLKAAGIAGF
ncbi:MAG: hypothetical protein KAH01_05315 [Caldisericia bacterium]|nr:hypothetical protein [Caldisericia bacterium]